MKLKEALSTRFLLYLLVLRPLIWAVFGINIRGRENLEDLDRFILISNHNSHLDTLLLYAALPLRQILRTHPVAAGDYFAKSNGLFRIISFLFQPIWIDRSGESGKALPAIQAALDRGANIIIFPEGTRGEPGRMQGFRSGIGRIVEANRSIPVVPAFLEGPERAFPRKAPFPIPLWNHVTIAPPQRLQGDCSDITLSLQRGLEDLNARAQVARQHRSEKRHRMFTTAMLGIDGSGKSTLSRRMAIAFSSTDRTCLISDRLELFERRELLHLQPLLTEKVRRWIGAQAKQAKSLVRYKIPKLAELLLRDRLLKEAGRWYRPEAVFMDGMPLLNLTAWSILYREEHFNEELCAKALAILTGRGPKGSLKIRRDDPIFRQFPELIRLKQLHLDQMQTPDLVIFLDVPPEVCIRRIDARGEKKQVHETEEKLAKLREAYLLVCSVLNKYWEMPVLVLDGGRALDIVAAEAQKFAENAKNRWKDECRDGD
ncbi:MAG: 1-acyl-sn-glycerol-3-phosphate acyltransferase [Candidatus Eisenbacteria bacterium]|uniref:1-acyl-sn-glycerol-3-phosphate acyltransferase n=1 Tax=Eiseniibacteriota bacterium TaxID=2212470 RepID=A0A948W6K1_UNCEI|nr:1-acyl-sn-glycerol-3-phosphate acyltransferase [Candidatus Eisenbacteria bacterium]MBU1950925.1 1-acyl-sn-glycerol-3-phosphate acyltransferase [Candidatus Eisenbacteria bacterium]MBU2691599.1 1-acyl-sn-glycerol-3-phosphate acyltransferase [Candidatus Eisenbacteria bacterium]